MFATRRGLIHKKSKPRWTGPYKIVKVNSEWDFEIQHLISKEVSHAHATRLSFYCDSSLNVTPDLKHQIAHDESNLTYQVESILAHDDSTGEYRFQIHWKGFDKEDSTWEPLSIISEDVPHLLQEYAQRSNDSILIEKLKALHL